MKGEVNDLLKTSKRPQKDVKRLVAKALILFVLWLGSYGVYLTFGGESLWANILLALPWALIMVSIQMSVMHDASHKATSDNSSINNLFLNVISFLGGSPTLWVHQHCVAHHSFTNVPGKDHDINTNGLLRLCEQQNFHSNHRFQHIYAWFLYPLFILSWVWWGDFRDIKGNTYSLKPKVLKKVIWETLFVKLWHVSLFLLLPLWTIGDPLLVLTGYLVSFGLMGFIMVVVFQLAHVSNVQQFSKKGTSSDWAEFQLATTANFATKNRFLSWYLGGLNHQIEHHIFPNYSHTHYPQIRPILKRACQSHNFHYHEFPSLFSAVKAHQHHLIAMGKRPLPRSQ